MLCKVVIMFKSNTNVRYGSILSMKKRFMAIGTRLGKPLKHGRCFIFYHLPISHWSLGSHSLDEWCEKGWVAALAQVDGASLCKQLCATCWQNYLDRNLSLILPFITHLNLWGGRGTRRNILNWRSCKSGKVLKMERLKKIQDEKLNKEVKHTLLDGRTVL